MIVSRGISALKALQRCSTLTRQNVRNSSHPCSYRVGAPEPSRSVILMAEVVQGFAWWWALWHLWTEPGHIFGEFEYPDPKKWTDEELGIPSD